MTGRPQYSEDDDRLARVDRAAEALLDAQTKAELLVAKAEKEMAEAIRVARRSPGTIPWRRIGQALGVSRQAVVSRWKGR